ncbi:hypothetical protein [Caenimonas koreensis]|uniref:hypothetical protein n=1 Tax=Caenimonas koreensis TaxID=367474 RepID=UPI0037843958
MTPVERSDVANGIWLCANCATLIDRDQQAYPPQLLRRWRHDAETKARRAHGRAPTKNADVVETLVTALTGRTEQFIPTAIENTHMASQEVLHRLDPRFDISTSHSEGVTTIQLNAREPVTFHISVDEPHAAEWRAGIESVVHAAREVTLPMRGVGFLGSQLLEALTKGGDHDGGQLTISPIGKTASLRLSSGPNGLHLDTISGHLFAGRDELRFEGSLYESLVQFRLCVYREGDLADAAEFTIGFSLQRWNGAVLSTLAYVNKLLDLVGAFGNATSFRADLEVRGDSVLHVVNPILKGARDFEAAQTFILYVSRAKRLSEFCNLSLVTNLEYAFTSAEHKELAEAVDIFEGRAEYGPTSFNEVPEATVMFKDIDAMESRFNESAPNIWKLVQPPQKIRVFGCLVELPPLEILLLNSRLEIVKVPKIKTGDDPVEARLRFHPTPDFRCIFQFAGQNQSTS